jgi:hypothetical protein
MKVINLFLYLLLSIACHGTASAQITFDGCNDIRGVPVASISDYSINDVAIASLAPDGTPIIQYNPNVLVWLTQQTRLFFYAHECGHHAHGHTFGTVHPLAREQDADCFAINALVEGNLVNENDIAIIQDEIARVGKGDWTHLPGPQRAINLRRCLNKPTTTSNWQKTTYCCDAFGRPWCQILRNPGPPGSPCYCDRVPGSGLICQ